MPAPVRARLFATALLAAIVTATPARAEMTEADREGARVFASCLDETGDNEDACSEKLGRYAWYPHDSATCEAVGTRVDNIIGLGGNPVWRDLFQNERCARLGMPHGIAGLPSPPDSPTGRKLNACEKKWSWDPCVELLGRHEMFDVDAKDGSCGRIAYNLNKPNADLEIKWWRRWFRNERCWRLGGAYFDTASAPPLHR